MFHPPHTKCVVETCPKQQTLLTEAGQRTGVLHTLDKGSVRASMVSLYCRGKSCTLDLITTCYLH